MAEKKIILQEIKDIIASIKSSENSDNELAAKEFLDIVNSLHQKTLLYQALPDEIETNITETIDDSSMPGGDSNEAENLEYNQAIESETEEPEKIELEEAEEQVVTDLETSITPEQEVLEKQEEEKEEEEQSISQMESDKDAEHIPVFSQPNNEQSPVSLADKFLSKDLSKSIGISEKFLFVNELFEGNTEEYTKQIGKINAAENLEKAREILSTLSSKNNWNKEEKACQTLNDLVERKFNA